MKEQEASNPLSNASSSTHVFAEDQEEEEAEEGEIEEAGNEESVDELLENAWTTMELARVIFKKHLEEKVASGMLMIYFLFIFAAKDKKYIQGKLSDVYLSLADLDRENENFVQAIEDYQSALALAPTDDFRKLATMFVHN